jgi:hypothetical protein
VIVLMCEDMIYFYKNRTLYCFGDRLVPEKSLYSSLKELCEHFNHINMPSLKTAIKVQVLVGRI